MTEPRSESTSTPAVEGPSGSAHVGVQGVLFDLGGVVLSSPFEAFEAYERRSGLPVGLIRTINAADHHTNAWARFERGELDVEGFVAAFEDEGRRRGHRVDGHAVLGCLVGTVRPEVASAVRWCSSRYPTGIVTNNVTPMAGSPLLDEELSALLSEVDVVIESSVVGIRKPEPAIYRLACERLGVPPSGVIFLDDLGVNLKPAREMGMITIKVTSGQQAVSALEEALGSAIG